MQGDPETSSHAVSWRRAGQIDDGTPRPRFVEGSKVGAGEPAAATADQVSWQAQPIRIRKREPCHGVTGMGREAGRAHTGGWAAIQVPCSRWQPHASLKQSTQTA